MFMFTNRIFHACGLKVLVILTLYKFCNAFHRKTTGVAFSPYVKWAEGEANQIPNYHSYKMEDVETMLKVISKNISKITTFGVGAPDAPYQKTVSYQQSDSIVMSAEAAARINKESDKTLLTILIGIWLSSQPHQINNEIHVAFESALLANSIFPGTVEGFVLTSEHIGTQLSEAQRALEQLLVLRNITTTNGNNLKLGTRQTCYRPAGNDLLSVRNDIIKESDFIICKVEPTTVSLPLGGKAGFNSIRSTLITFRNDFRKINSRIEVMAETGWPSKGENAWENIHNLEEFWNTADNWANQNGFTVWLLEALDQPWKKWLLNAAHYGWWQLTDNTKACSEDGYVEKIKIVPAKKISKNEKMEEESTPNKSIGWELGVGITAALVAILAITLVIYRFIKKRRGDALTREFFSGISDEEVAALLGDSNDGSASAYQLPYDRSLEIALDKMQIETDKLLGSGQFGIVCKASIRKENGRIEVALKMLRNNCSESDLRGLLSEIKILTYLGRHPNIVSIQGAYTAELFRGKVYMATELCGLGSLKSYLGKCFADASGPKHQLSADTTRYVNLSGDKGNGADVTMKDFIQWSYEIACGMEYLGTRNIVHADLSARNVLLTSERSAKITDFGLSRKLNEYRIYVKKQVEPLPWGWMSIEALKRLEFSTKSDVWSYGVTLWEMFSLGEHPYPGYTWNPDFVEELSNGMRMKCPGQAPPTFYEIMTKCWQEMPNDRPTFTDLKKSTAALLENERQ